MKEQEGKYGIIRNGKTKRLLLLAFAFTGSYVISFIILPYASWKHSFDLPVHRLVMDIIANLAISAVFLEFVLWIEKRLNKSMPWTIHPLKRLLVQSVLQITGVLFLIFCMGMIYLLINGLPDKQAPLSENAIRQAWGQVIALVLLVLMMSALNTGDYLVTNWKRAAMQAAEYKIKAAESRQLAAETELQALRLQLDPHFVFNNLSVLSELILKDPLLGYEYTENFAKVYRYLLSNAKNRLITLQEELKFLNAYLFLLSKRMGEGVIFQTEIDESTLQLQLPPATLQLFVENALKYNRTEKDTPLVIRIYTTAHYELVVFNTLLPLLKKPYSTGIGLQNILGRYALLTDRKPSVEIGNDSFTVKVPLI